jgi:hypothetical protein
MRLLTLSLSTLCTCTPAPPEHHHDTIVDSAELLALVTQALGMGINPKLPVRAPNTEL